MTLSQLTLTVLAGGKARRMGGEDKGLIPLNGRPMVQHVLDRVRRPGMPVLLVANRNQEAYGALGLPLLSDCIEGFLGPLAGILTALDNCDSPYMLVCPCDTPRLPSDLAERMLATLLDEQAEVVVANDGERDHPVVMLLRRDLAPSIRKFITGGDRKIYLWYAQHKVSRCIFNNSESAFANINTPEQQQELEQLLKNQK